jgi:hypothetical protein
MHFPTRNFVLFAFFMIVLALTTGCGHGGGGGAVLNVYPRPTTTVTPTPTPTVFPTPNPTPTLIPTVIPSPTPTVIPTPSPTPVNPLTILSPTNVTSDSATLNGTVAFYPEVLRPAIALGFQWALQTTAGQEVWSAPIILNPSSQMGLISTRISGQLQPSTTYSYRIFLNIDGFTVWYSEVVNFFTLATPIPNPSPSPTPTPTPTVTPTPTPTPAFNPLHIFNATSITSTSATLNGSVDEYPGRGLTPTVLGFQYALANPGNEIWSSVFLFPSNTIGAKTTTVTGLSPGTNYSFRLYLALNSTTEFYSDVFNFTTP